MALSAALRELTAVVGRIEEDGYVVEDVTVPEGSLVTDDAVTVKLSMQLPLAEQIAHGNCAEITVDGCDVHGAIPAELSVTIPLDAVAASTTLSGPGRTNNRPRYKDPVALRQVYDQFETFEAMTEELGVDVSPSTVRRHMIKHGIHEPEPMYPADGEPGEQQPMERASVVPETAEPPSPEGPREPEPEQTDDDTEDSVVATANDSFETKHAVTDGLGLPEHLTLDDMVDIVEESSTVFEASRKMDVEHDRAVRVLRSLNLIDLVTGRMRTREERQVPDDVIKERIQSAVQTHAAG